MKLQKIPRCPGCGKHCPMSNPRCKYGRAYFAKMQAQQEKQQETYKYKYKWEAYVTRGSPAWQMLMTLRSVKKALRKKRLTEAELLARLTGEEQRQLLALLQKLDGGDSSCQRGEKRNA